MGYGGGGVGCQEGHYWRVREVYIGGVSWVLVGC